MKGEESPGFILRLPNSKRTPLCQRKSQKTGAGALMEGSDSLPLTWKMVRRKSKATARQLTLLPLLLLDLLISPCGLGPRRNPGTSSEATALESVRQDWQYQSISEQCCPGTAGALGQGASRLLFLLLLTAFLRALPLESGGYAEIQRGDWACSPENLYVLETIMKAVSSRPLE